VVQTEIDLKFDFADQVADGMNVVQVNRKNVANQYGKTVTSMRSRCSQDKRQRYACTSRCGRMQAAVLPATAMRACPRWRLWYIGGLINMVRRCRLIIVQRRIRYKRLCRI